MSKISLRYAINVNPSFATASELAGCLLASYPDAAYFHAPVVGRNRDDTAPAWGWIIDLIRMRTDWLPAIGIALQHAATDGDDLARVALADLLAEFRDSIVLLPWTAPLAERWPDVMAAGSGTGWGVPDRRLVSIVRDQMKYLPIAKQASREPFLLGYGKRGKAISGPLTNEDELRVLLDETARAGQFPDGDKGPWSWLGFEQLVGEPWISSAFVRIMTNTKANDEPRVFAFLDLLSEERDLWRFAELLASWREQPWSGNAARTKPSGWKRGIRSAHWPEVETMGDVVSEALGRARKQGATPPVIDLPRLYGVSGS